MKLPIQALSKTAFEPFGDVIETEGSESFVINEGSTLRYHDLAKVEVDKDSRVLVNIFRATPLSYPLKINSLERHPLGSQAFVPLSACPYLVLVAPPGDAVEVNDLRAFYATSKQGVNYHKNVWHHPVLALEKVSDFLVIDRGGKGNNCEQFFLAEEQEIWLDR